NTLKVRLQGDFDPLMRAISDGYVVNIHMEDPTLEDIFLAFYGEETVASKQTVQKAEFVS
ncbi:MAG: hypothetical protein AAFQ52_19805, partial [Chloroflexota bacterium]